ncbi:hypothetical protein [Iodidimonas sp. SYSU 1G8]|uniref:hypothetical protein n=1 Tax=Iodidimonas sp. SYSU 1G8 TaxID=3133967 RepID=UPI0031FEA439
MARTLTFQATQGIARLTPVHLELVSAALTRAGASGLKPRWITKNVQAELRYEGIDGDKAIELANGAVKGSGLVIENKPEA